MLFQPASPGPVLALVTTLHLGLATLRNHRSASALPLSPQAVVAFTLAALPWLFPSATGLALGVGLQAAWFAACELLAPPLARATTASRPAIPAARAMPAPAAAAARPSGPPGPRPDPAFPKGFVHVPVVATIDETPTIKTIRLSRPAGFEFQAGQFMPVRIRVDGRELTRCYSISSSPEATGYVEISVRRQGVVSNALHALARPGTLLSIRRPAGGFTYPGGDDRPIALIAAGIGVTPLMSMLRHGVATEPSRPIALVYGAHAETDFAFRDELESLARRHPQFRLQLAAASGPTTPRVYRGRIDGALLRAAVPELPHSIALVCGPAPMIESMKRLLLAAGVPAPQVRHEAFDAAVAAAAEAPGRPAPTATGPGYRIGCTVSGRQLAIGRNQTLLEAADAGGVEVASLCRAGVCGTCRVRVTRGAVDCDSAALDADEVEAGFVLACVATVRSDCEVAL